MNLLSDRRSGRSVRWAESYAVLFGLSITTKSFTFSVNDRYQRPRAGARARSHRNAASPSRPPSPMSRRAAG